MNISGRFLEVKLLRESAFTFKILMFAAKMLSKKDMSFPAQQILPTQIIGV